MRRIQKNGKDELCELICNKCGKRIRLYRGCPKEGVCHVENQWGYFSKKDGERHSFDLCEECYDEMVKEFVIPVEVEEMTELL